MDKYSSSRKSIKKNLKEIDLIKVSVSGNLKDKPQLKSEKSVSVENKGKSSKKRIDLIKVEGSGDLKNKYQLSNIKGVSVDKKNKSSKQSKKEKINLKQKESPKGNSVELYKSDLKRAKEFDYTLGLKAVLRSENLSVAMLYSGIRVSDLLKSRLKNLERYINDLNDLENQSNKLGKQNIVNMCRNKIAIYQAHYRLLKKEEKNSEVVVFRQFTPVGNSAQWNEFKFAKRVEFNGVSNVQVNQSKIKPYGYNENSKEKTVVVYFSDAIVGGGYLRGNTGSLQEETGLMQNPIMAAALAHDNYSVTQKPSLHVRLIHGGEYADEEGTGTPLYVNTLHFSLEIETLSRLYGNNMQRSDLSKEIGKELSQKPLEKSNVGHLFLAAPRNKAVHGHKKDLLRAAFKLFEGCYTAFVGVKETEVGKNVTIESGLLGCGYFEIPVKVSVGVQMLAAKAVGVDINFNVPGYRDFKSVQNSVHSFNNYLDSALPSKSKDRVDVTPIIKHLVK